MKFLCIPCDVKMEVQTEGIMPEEKANLAMKFKCKNCGHNCHCEEGKGETNVCEDCCDSETGEPLPQGECGCSDCLH